MILSKSFGYALRGILYIAAMQDENRKVQIEEIATKLSVPKHFLGKIMQQVVKAGLLKSTKGPFGGFSLTAETLNTSVIRLVEITDGMEQFSMCVLNLKYCNGLTPCPFHYEMEDAKKSYLNVFIKNTFGNLLQDGKGELLKSLTVR
jgi:Rrf2 family iron-sulfur cluster assembly transcriptional regulator